MSAIQIKKAGKALTFFIMVMVATVLLLTANADAALQKGTWEVEVKVYQAGTTQESRSGSSVKSPAVLKVGEEGLLAQVAFKHASMTDIVIGEASAQILASDDEWTTYQFTLTDENATVPVSVSVPAMGNARLIVDLAFLGNTAVLVEAETPTAADTSEDSAEASNSEEASPSNEAVNSGEASGSGQASAAESVSDTAPKTADSFNGMFLTFVCLLAIAGLTVVVRRSKAVQ